MVKHIILWNLKDEYSPEQKEQIKVEIKEAIESLQGKVPGLVDIKVQTGRLASSSADLMLDATLESEEALKGYAVHPEHVKVANENVRPYTQSRSCLDFEISLVGHPLDLLRKYEYMGGITNDGQQGSNGNYRGCRGSGSGCRAGSGGDHGRLFQGVGGIFL